GSRRGEPLVMPVRDLCRVARRIQVGGVVQGVGFRPWVYRLAREHGVAGWVFNGDDGVRIHVEGSEAAIEAFVAALRASPPPAARVATIVVEAGECAAVTGFAIRASESDHQPTTRISPDLAICDACLAELFDPDDCRFRYPYINCTN